MCKPADFKYTNSELWQYLIGAKGSNTERLLKQPNKQTEKRALEVTQKKNSQLHVKQKRFERFTSCCVCVSLALNLAHSHIVFLLAFHNTPQ